MISNLTPRIHEHGNCGVVETIVIADQKQYALASLATKNTEERPVTSNGQAPMTENTSDNRLELWL
jgi:hypothetical protein